MYSGGTFNEIYEKYSSIPKTKKNLEREGKRLETAIALMKLREEKTIPKRYIVKIYD